MKTVVVLQPGYLPWLGFFDQMSRSDVFVYYDDVQFDKHGWRNRNRIKTPEGPQWLTVPVYHKGLGKPRILDIEINNETPWARKHLGSIRQHYAKAPFFSRYWPELEELLSKRWEKLVDLDIAVAWKMCSWLGIERQVVRSSELGIEGDRNERLLKICQHFQADRYLSGQAAQEYLDEGLFHRSGIKVEWHEYHHPVYFQQYGEFIPFLSALDLLLNVGEESRKIITASGSGS